MENLIPTKKNGVRERKEKFGKLLVSPTGYFYTINPDAERLWNQIDGKKSVGVIMKTLSGEYDKSSFKNSTYEFFKICELLELVAFL